MSFHTSKSYSEHFVDANGARIWACSTGEGTPVLVFNGGPGCSDYLGPVANLIEDECKVIRFEPRGCGRSDWDGDYSLETLIKDADAVRQFFDLDAYILIGHSFGPDVALAYALRFPTNVIGLIGIAGGRIVNDRGWHATYKQNLRNVGENLGDVVFTADPNVNPVCNESWREYTRRPALLREICALEIPATYIFGSEDIRPDWPTRQLAALLPNGQFVEIKGAAHAIWLTHANELRTELANAIERIRKCAKATRI